MSRRLALQRSGSGKGMRHHEVVIAFSLREVLKWLRQPSAKRFEAERELTI